MLKMTRTAEFMIVLTAALMIMAASPEAKGFRGRIIDDMTGEPVSGAAVVIVKIDDPTVIDGLRSDEEGRFDTEHSKFAAMYTVGSIIRISINAQGYEEYEEIVVLAREHEEKEYVIHKLDNKVQRVFHIQHRDPAEIYDVIRPLCTRQVSLSPSLRTITVVETPKVLEEIESEIKKHDLPLRQIWLDVLLVEASGTNGGKPRYPQQLKPIIGKLGALFKFDRYEIIGQANAMGMEGSSLTFSSDLASSEESKAVFKVKVGRLGFASGTVRLTDLTVVVEKPQQKKISTTINIPDEDMVILGASRGNSGKGSIVILVTADVNGGM